jgi:uncharacterized membrane protein
MVRIIMADIESQLSRWKSAGILDAAAADRIRAYESDRHKSAGIAWQGMLALILGGILLACGVVLFVSAHWDSIGPGGRFALVAAMVAVFHLGGALTRENFRGLSTTLHAVGTVATGAAIALVGQIFNIEEHWPAAILMWAVAAAAGWALLRDQAQQILTLLLFPAWMLSELAFYTEGHIGQFVYVGRFLFAWAVLYLTFFLGSKRRAVQGILFGLSIIAAVVGIVMMLVSWRSYGDQTFIPFDVRFWAWCGIAALPLVIAAFKGHRGLIPPAVAIAFAEALPWCQRHWTRRYDWDPTHTAWTEYGPSLLAHRLVAAFALFLMWWGVRQASRALVNLGTVGFGAAVAWFYFSDIFDKVGRSLGLIGLGVLFLAGGWALERARRRLMRRMDAAGAAEVAR